MRTDSEQQVARFAEALDRNSPPISVDEIIGRGTVEVVVDLPARSSWNQALHGTAVSSSDAIPNHDGNGERCASIELIPVVDGGRPARRLIALKVVLAAAAAAALVVALGAIVRSRDASVPADMTPVTTDIVAPFVGGWQSTDTDGSSQTMYVAQWGSNEYEVVVTDEEATCPGGAQTAGIGRRATDTSLVIARPEAFCWDASGSSPASVFEPDPFTLDFSVATDELVDSLGVVWRKLVVPALDADDTALLEAFLGARLAGQGAEQYLLTDGPDDQRVPLLYSTSGGAAYERFEIEPATDPYPQPGSTKVAVRLFAEDGTVVEQRFHVEGQAGQRGLFYGQPRYDLPTTEDSESVPVSFSILDGEVTFTAAPPWEEDCCSPEGDGNFDREGSLQRGWNNSAWFVIAAEPLSVGTACDNGPAPVDAAALARSIVDDPNSEATEPVPVRIAGIDGFQIDVLESEYGWLCAWDTGLLSGFQGGGRVRLYMVDYPGDSAEVLAFAVVAPPDDWEDGTADIAPILDSIRIHLD